MIIMYDKLKKIIKGSSNIVFFGGAGVSTESNIPDFRSQSGLYSKKTYSYRAETMISSDFFFEHPEQFYDFYFHEMVHEHAKPNDAHVGLAKMELEGRLKAVITQNIDGLHQMAGSKEVIELHGSIHRNRCRGCHKLYTLQDMLKQKGHVPKCPKCGRTIKPEVVLYGESLHEETIKRAISYIEKADVIIVGGTSLVVYPAAGLLQYFHGSTLVLINKEETAMDTKADFVLHDSIGKVFKELMKLDGKDQL